MSTPPAPTASAAPPAPIGDPVAPAPVAPAAPQLPTPQAPAASEPQDVASLPTWAQKLIGDTRQEAAGHRTRATAAEQAQQAALDQVARALGLKTDGTPDPAAVAAQLTQAQAAHRQQLLENAVLRASGRLGANPDALLDSRAFAAQVAELDPGAADFQSALDAAIKAATTANPGYAAAPQAGAQRSGAELTGGPGRQAAPRSTSLSAAISGHYQAGS